MTDAENERLSERLDELQTLSSEADPSAKQGVREMTAEATQRCCNCEFGQRVRMDINYKYPIQYICKLTGDRVYTQCYDNPSPVWCPHRVIVSVMSDKEIAVYVDKIVKKYKELVDKGIAETTRRYWETKAEYERVKGDSERIPAPVKTSSLCEECRMRERKRNDERHKNPSA